MSSDQSLFKLTEQPSTLEKQGFDYGSLPGETQIIIEQRTNEIKSLLRRTAQDIVDIGRKLTEVKQQLGHGHFIDWLKSEFNWSLSTATRFMQVSEQFKFVNLANLEISASALYLLAAPSYPAVARQEVLERATLGETISYTKAKAIVSDSKKAAKPEMPKPCTFAVPGQIVEEQSQDKLEEKLPREKTEAVYFQGPNRSCSIVSTNNSSDCLLKNQTEIAFRLLALVGNLIYLTDLEQQESKLFGEVAEVKEVTNTDVIIRISLQQFEGG